jgi:hypothetical protein
MVVEKTTNMLYHTDTRHEQHCSVIDDGPTPGNYVLSKPIVDKKPKYLKGLIIIEKKPSPKNTTKSSSFL